MSHSLSGFFVRACQCRCAGLWLLTLSLVPLPSSASEIWFIRHAESEVNVIEHPTEPDTGLNYPLTLKGVEQALAFAESVQEVDIRSIYASTRLRAIQTADAVAFSQGMTLTTVPEMAEMHVDIDYIGDQRVLGERLIALWRQDPYARLGDSESLADLQERVASFQRRLIERHGEDDGVVMVFAHGGIIGFGLLSLCANPVAWWAMEPPGLVNTGVLKTRVVGDGLVCTEWQGRPLPH